MKRAARALPLGNPRGAYVRARCGRSPANSVIRSSTRTMERGMRTITAWLAGVALATALFAGLSSSAEAEGPLENLVIQRHTLSNGLRVVLNPDPKVPTVA